MLAGTAAGFVIGGVGGGGLGALGGPLSPGTVPAGATIGAVKGAAIGAGIGAAIDATIVFAKGESAQIGAAIEAILGKSGNTRENRRDVGDYCEECKANGVTGSKNSRGDFTFKELKERVREFFGRGR
jgi:hypothetical protein